MVGTKLSDDERDAVDQRAFREGVTIRGGEANTSEMIRIMCAYAVEHMPEGWRTDAANRPGRGTRTDLQNGA